MGAASAFAGTATSTLGVSAEVVASCTITSAAPLVITYDPVVVNLTAPATSTAALTVSCTSGSASTITLGQGVNFNTGSTDAIPARRALNGTANFLSYALYQDAGNATIWGNTPATGKAHTGTGNLDEVIVYASMAGAQNVPAGTYSDSVVATVTF
jgi:spore coat protein U-like protein